ncbi:MAG: glycosyltransferase, partial [Halobacteriales archaeon]|nr:glycosyltransferase [Halobacteriales archaeon]
PRFSPLVTELRAEDFRIVYDLMDDWSDTALGGWGYRTEDELAAIRRSDGLVASAPSLVGRLEQMSGRPVALVPNAVNTRIFHPRDSEPPADLPPGDGPVIEYHGSLYGDWFDWDALRAAAEQHESARFVIIGDARRHPEMPDNVHFLGLKPQHLLPAYLAHTDVAIIPFEVSETTHAVSPLKVFEYLAMGVPVASTPIAPVVGLEGVSTDSDLGAAISAALDASPSDPSTAASQHGWGERLSRLFSTVDLELEEDPDADPITISQHSVRHWSHEERRL